MCLPQRLRLLVFCLGTCAVQGNASCASFQTNNTIAIENGVCYLTVEATVNNNCAESNTLTSVNVLENPAQSFPPSICIIKFEDSKCVSTVGCVCNNDTSAFNFQREMESSQDVTLLLIGRLRHGDTFQTTNQILSKYCARTTDLLSSEFPSTTHDVTSTTTSTVYSDLTRASSTTTSPSTSTSTPVTPTNQPPERQLIIILGSSGCALLFFVGLAIVFHAVMRKRKVGGRRGRLPPPPALHNMRRVAGGEVMFRVHPAPLPDSVHVHDYAEIPDDTDTSLSNTSHTPSDSSSVSDSSMSDDCLHHIACPSSDSSLPEDYLNPVESEWEANAAIAEEDSSSSAEAVMYAKERITFKKKSTKKITTAQVEPY